MNGKIVIGASCLSGQVLDDPEGYRWLWPYSPTGLIDKSMWVFDTGR